MVENFNAKTGQCSNPSVAVGLLNRNINDGLPTPELEQLSLYTLNINDRLPTPELEQLSLYALNSAICTRLEAILTARSKFDSCPLYARRHVSLFLFICLPTPGVAIPPAHPSNYHHCLHS